MHKQAMKGLRAAGFIAIAIAVAQCGDSSVRVVGSGNIDPTPGTFTGSTNSGGGQVVLLVGSVESATLVCNGQTFGGSCNPVLAVQSSTAIGNCNGLNIDVTFVTNDEVQINDISAGTDCDGGGSADRLVGPTPTVTPGPGDTPTVTATPTGGPTSTDVTPTVTPTNGGLPTDQPTTASTPCPTRLTVEGIGSQAILNTGTTGIAFNQSVIDNGALTVAVSDCSPGVPGDCGTCNVTGPVQSNTAVNNQRCQGDTSMECTSDGDCGGSAPCVFSFGSYLPLSSGGVPVCVRNVVNGQITGVIDIEAGTGSSVTSLISQVFSGILPEQPCPACSGASFLDAGTCSGGPRDGQACTVHGTTDKLGNTSFDCPPNEASNLGNLNINLSPTTGTSTLNATETCDTFPFGGLVCYCAGQNFPNSCTNGLCESLDNDGVGTCDSGQDIGICRPSDTFLTCLSDGDCPTGGDTCQFEPRACHGPQDVGTLAINGPLTRTGTASTTNPTLAATFCIAAVSSSAVNEAAGLPGPGTLLLPSNTCFTNDTDGCTF